jgi:putative membrane protein
VPQVDLQVVDDREDVRRQSLDAARDHARDRITRRFVAVPAVLYGRSIVVRVVVNWALSALAFAITAAVLHGMTIHGGVFAYFWVSLLFGLVNVVAGTILRLITLPLTVLTMGLSLFLVNAVVLSITDWLTTHLDIDDFFWTTIWAAVILSVVTMLLDLVAWAARRGT